MFSVHFDIVNNTEDTKDILTSHNSDKFQPMIDNQLIVLDNTLNNIVNIYK